jgi:competence protein ComEA
MVFDRLARAGGGRRVALVAFLGLALLVVVAMLGLGVGRRGILIERGEGSEGSGDLQVSSNPQVQLEESTSQQFQQSSGDSQEPSSMQVDDAPVALVVVDIDGAVNNPGVYELQGETVRLRDAVAAAGGLAEDADAALINLAAPIQDGAKLHIPRVGEDLSAYSSAYATGVLASGGSAGASAGASASGGSSPEAASSGATSETALININTATNEELQTLPGIGQATAAAIVEERESNGPFASVEDLMRVSGIGEKKLARLRELICV